MDGVVPTLADEATLLIHSVVDQDPRVVPPPPVLDARTVLIHSVAGTVGGVAGIYCGSPFDVIKVRMQLSSRSALEIARETWRVEGVRGFFRGAAAVSLGQAPVNAVIFAAYAAALHALERARGAQGSEPAPLRSLAAAGCAAGLAQAFVLAPFELLKVQQQSARGAGGAELGLRETAAAVARALGPRGLFRGLVATCVRDAPTFGLYFSSYEMGKRAGVNALGLPPDASAPAGVLLAAGALAGAASWAVALPADVVKSIVQAAPLHAPAGSLRWAVVAGGVWRAGGARAFFRGFVPCVLRSLPVNAVTFYGYETALSYIDAATAAASSLK